MSNTVLVDPPQLVIRASAGSGKTFQLSNRFLQLIQKDAPISEILATTFTRKAAGEILERILLRLSCAATDSAAAEELAGFLDDSNLTQERCLELLERMARQMHRLRVGTLDSFFAQMARSHSVEIGLPPGWQIVDEITGARLRDRALEEVLENNATDDVTRLVNLLAKGDAERSVSQLARDTIDGLYALYLASDERAWQVPRGTPLSEDTLAEACSTLAKVLLPTDQRFAQARNKDLDAARAADWEGFIERGLAKKVLDGATHYCSKEIAPKIRAAYQPLLEHVKAVFLAQLANQTEATFELLQKYDTVLQRLKTEQRGLRFDDVTCALARHANRNGVDELAFRMDGRITHLLLDEFQDTSTEQWKVLRPFAQHISRSAGGSFFSVGDVKQAIYGWRGGLEEIFDSLESDVENLVTEQLEKSYRSAPPVIDVVNQVFSGLTQHNNLDDYEPPIRDWQDRFPIHQTHKELMGGYVTLETAPPARNGDKQNLATLRYAAEKTARLARQAPHQEIGVLVRRNVSVARLIFELRKLGVPASEEGGNPLTDSAAVQVIMSLLRIADHPGDSVAWFHVAHAPMAEALEIEQGAFPEKRSMKATEWRRQLMEQGYRVTVEKWSRLLLPYSSRREAARLAQLVTLASQYEPDATLRPRDFIKYIELQRVADTESGRVRVMTIHQAKGLEFDIVVLPELDGRLTGQAPPCAVRRDARAGPITNICIYRNKVIQSLLPSQLQEAFRQTQDREVKEDLCVLYVAMTRAIHALHMIVAPSKENEQSMPKTYAGLLRAALFGTDPVPAAQLLFERGETDWYRHRLEEEVESAGARATPQPIRFALPELRNARRRGLDSTSPSQMEGSAEIRLGDLFDSGRSMAMTRGTLVHAWFERVVWLDDGQPPRDELAQVARRYGTAGLDIDNLLDAFYTTLRDSRVAELLSRSAYISPSDMPLPAHVLAELAADELHLDVRCEYPIAVIEDDTLVTGTIDRLVLMRRGDRVLAADVIDFKTDTVEPDNEPMLAAKVEHYRPQIEAYRTAVAKMLQIDKSRIAARLLFVEGLTVRNV